MQVGAPTPTSRSACTAVDVVAVGMGAAKQGTPLARARAHTHTPTRMTPHDTELVCRGHAVAVGVEFVACPILCVLCLLVEEAGFLFGLVISQCRKWPNGKGAGGASTLSAS